MMQLFTVEDVIDSYIQQDTENAKLSARVLSQIVVAVLLNLTLAFSVAPLALAGELEKTILSSERAPAKSKGISTEDSVTGKTQRGDVTEKELSQTTFEMAKHTFNLVIGIFGLVGVLIAIVGLLVGTLGVFGYKMLQRFVQETMKTEVDKVRFQFSFRADVVDAIGYYEKDVERAIALTKRALTSGRLLPEHIIVAKSNLAYYYAGRGHIEDKSEALRLGNEAAEEGIQVLPYNVIDFQINLGYVKLKFAQTEQETTQAKHYLNEILNREDCTQRHRQEIEQYFSLP